MIPFLTFIFVMVVTAILFGSWVIVSVSKMIWRGLNGSPRPMPPTIGRQCGNPGCRAGNPVHAQFCRRCGANLMQPVSTRMMNQPQPRFNPTNGSGRQMAGV
jgi:ribosomal protein L40E